MLNVEEKLVLELVRHIGQNELYVVNEDLIRNANWDVLFNILDSQKIFQMCYPIIEKYIPQYYKEKYKAKSKVLITQNKICMEAIKEIMQITQKENIEILFIKGIILSHQIYGDYSIRKFGDIDMLVHKKDFEKIKLLLNKIGFLNTYYFDEEIVRLREPTTNKLGVYHEQWFTKYYNGQIIILEIKTYTSAIRERYIDYLWKHKTAINIDRLTIYTTDMFMTFLHLCANCYGNTERRFNIEDKKICLRDFIDIAVVLKNIGNRMNWDLVDEYSQMFQITHKMYVVLNYIKLIFPNLINNEVLDHFLCNKIKYHYTGLLTGTIVPWKSNFLERIFNKERQISEYMDLFYKRLLSEENKFFYDRIKIDDTINNIKFYEMICTKDTGFKFQYGFYKKSDYLCLIIKFDLKNYEYFKDNVELDFQFFYHPASCEGMEQYIIKVLRVFCDKGIFKCKYNNKIFPVSCNAKEDIFLHVDIDLDYLKLGCDPYGLIPYNIYVFEFVVPNTFPLLIGVKYSEDEDEEESPDMAILEL